MSCFYIKKSRSRNDTKHKIRKDDVDNKYPKEIFLLRT